ncbi:hypothetical protein [Nocardia iowensis]|uniref:Uncharacterized protein n=1 Tax=Nocardia iowensis TaxID=204891 RepID=A0ABX8RU96_NOCIO|nr:hypothetical protein [Nocardia iowensis]QXN93203.1 hypothetical protein KV110_08930 [Nocardia iowensis]
MRLTTFRIVVVSSVTVLAAVFPQVAGAGGPGLPSGPVKTAKPDKDKGAMYRSILVEIPGVKFPEARSMITPNQMYYIGEAMCTHDDLGEVRDELNKELKNFYVEFGDPARPDDIVGKIWKAAFGDSKYTEKVQRGICAVVADEEKYADYVATAKKIVSGYGENVRVQPEYAGEEAEDHRRDFWAEKLGAFGTALKPWLPIDLKSA